MHNLIPGLKKNASQNKLSVSFLHDFNKHNVYRGMKLTIRKSMLLMQMSMWVLNSARYFGLQLKPSTVAIKEKLIQIKDERYICEI